MPGRVTTGSLMIAMLAVAACRGGNDGKGAGSGSASGAGTGSPSSPTGGSGAGTGASPGPGSGSGSSGPIAGTSSHGPAAPVTKDGFRDQIRAYILATLKPLCPADGASCVDSPAEPPHPLVAWRPADPTTLTVSVLMPSFDDDQLVSLNVAFCDLLAELGDRLDDTYILQARIVNLPAEWGSFHPFTTSGSSARMIAKLERNHRLNVDETSKLLGRPTIATIDGKRIAIHKLDDGGEVRIPVEAPRLPDVKLVDPRGTIRPIRFAVPTTRLPTTPVQPTSPTTVHPTTPVRPTSPTTVHPTAPTPIPTTPIRPAPTTPIRPTPTTPVRPTPLPPIQPATP